MPPRQRRRSKNEETASDTEADGDSGGEEPCAPIKTTGHSKGEQKLSKLAKRLVFGTLLLGFLVMVVALGHLWVLSLVLLTQVAVFRELVHVRYKQRRFKDIPLFRTMQWWWFWAGMLYSYGSSLGSEHNRGLVSSRIVLAFLPYVELSFLFAYSGMLITTVMTLQTGYYKYQVGQLAWTVTIIVVTVLQVHSFTHNILNGIFWFLFPVSLVICNDSMAYFAGMAFGRKCIKREFLGALSPNKTWEGFIGGGICTVIFAFLAPLVYVKMPFLICPCQDLRFMGERWGFPLLELSCELPPVFAPTTYATPLLGVLTGTASLTLLPIQLHALALGAFASLVAPFGGFFASGIKRAYKLDDFASLIPGHGGVYDRVDCQLIMGLATQIYYSTFIGLPIVSVRRAMQLAASMGKAEQVALYKQLGETLRANGLINRWA